MRKLFVCVFALFALLFDTSLVAHEAQIQPLAAIGDHRRDQEAKGRREQVQRGEPCARDTIVATHPRLAGSVGDRDDDADQKEVKKVLPQLLPAVAEARECRCFHGVVLRPWVL